MLLYRQLQMRTAGIWRRVTFIFPFPGRLSSQLRVKETRLLRLTIFGFVFGDSAPKARYQKRLGQGETWPYRLKEWPDA